MSFLKKAFLIISVVLLSFDCFAGNISADLQALLNFSSDGEIPIIVKFKKSKISLQKKDKASLRKELVKKLKSNFENTRFRIKPFFESKKLRGVKEIWHINAFAFKASPKIIEELANLFDDIEIKYDKTFDLPNFEVNDSSTNEWNINLIKANELWNLNIKGQNVVVANLDTGVDYTHPDLYTKWRGGNNSWYDPYGVYTEPHDSNGHGTQTMGIIVGGNLGGTNVGVAPEAKWISARIFDDNGKASISSIHLAFSWLLDPDGDPDTDDLPDIVNNSWGFIDINQCDNEFLEDINLLKSADISVVFSAGNSGPYSSTSVSPANNQGVLSVGSIDSNLNISLFSSRGPSACTGDIFPALVAPGNFIKTTDLYMNGRISNPYVVVSGTSFSAPHISGALALLKSAFPDRKMNELEEALKKTAIDLGDYGVDNNYGFGLIDLKFAYDYLQNNPRIYVSRQAYDFSKVLVNTISSPVTFVVMNKGGSELVINSVILDGSGKGSYEIISEDCSGSSLLNNQSCSINVRFIPDNPGTFETEIVINSNDPENPDKRIKLTGNGILTKLTLLSPNGGEILHAGDTFEIKWAETKNTVYYTIQLSKNGGYTWINIAKFITGNKFLWEVPTDVYNRTKCLIRVLGYDLKKRLIEKDMSDIFFTIEVIEIKSPVASGIIYTRNYFTITWDTFKTIDVPAKTLIYFSNNGFYWIKIGEIDANPGRFNWFVAQKPSTKCFIKIVLKNLDNKTISVVKNYLPFTIN